MIRRLALPAVLSALLVAVLPTSALAEPLPAGPLQPLSCLHDGIATDVCNGADGLTGAFGVAISSDHLLVAVASGDAASVTTFAVDATTGEETPAGCIWSAPESGLCLEGHDLAGASDVAFSPDHQYLYAVSTTDSALTVFAVDGAGGISQLTGAGSCFHAAATVATGAAACAQDLDLDGASGIVVSPDGKNAYVITSGSNAIIGYTIASNGSLQRIGGIVGCMHAAVASIGCDQLADLGTPTDIAISPDGASLYVTSAGTDAVLDINRVPVSGIIFRAQGLGRCIRDAISNGTCVAGQNLTTPVGVAVSPDGTLVFVAATGGVTSFTRSTADGTIVQVGAAGCAIDGSHDTSGCQAGHDLADPTAVAVSRDGTMLFVTSSTPGAVVALAVAADGALTPSSDPTWCIHQDLATFDCQSSDDLTDAGGVVASTSNDDVYVTSYGSPDAPSALVGLRGAHAPVCESATFHVERGVARTIPLRCTDADGDPLTISLVTPAGYGSTPGPIDSLGQIRYHPPATFVGADSFTFQATDLTNVSAIATITIEVSDRVGPAMKLKLASPRPRGGRVRVALTCSGNDACRGTVRIRASATGAVYGKARFSVRIGRRVTLSVKLSRRAMATLASRGKLTAVALATATDGYGNTRNVRIRASLRR